MYSFSSIETFDDEFNSLRKLALPRLLSSAVDRSPNQSASAIAYLDMKRLLVDDSQFVEQLFSDENRSSAPLALWICNWENSVSVEKIVGYLTALKEKLVQNKFDFHFVLPDPVVCSEKARLCSISIDNFLRKFTVLASCETQPIVASEAVIPLLKRVMSLGIRTNIIVDVSLIEDPLHVAKGPDFDADDDIILNRVCSSAYELKVALANFSSLYSIQTFSFSSEVKQTLSSPFAVPLLRTLCLLRHIFPSSVLLSASPGLLGKHLYLLINELGICSRREGAFDVQSSKSLNIPLLSEITRIPNYAN
jgi:hypothetical protein